MISGNRQGRPSGRVLITDGHWNKSVAAIRALGKHDLKITAGESTRLAAGLFSRYVDRRLHYPAPLTQPDAFLKAIVAELQTEQYDVLLPMELSTLLLLSSHRQRFAELAAFPFAPHATLVQAAHKKGAVLAAKQAGIPVPGTVFVDAGTTVKGLLAEPGLPMVLKPDFGEGSRGLFYCRTEAELEQAMALIAKQDEAYLAQELIPPGGDALGVALLLDQKRRVVARFTHRRLREYPLSGGPSTLREAYDHPEAAAYAEKLLRSIDFHGIAMVEFKVDPRDNVPKLMEINPRFWGSLPLAIKAGVDFPWLLYCMAVGSTVEEPVQQTGTRLRNLLPGDLMYFIAKRGRVGRDFFDFTNSSDELVSFDDLGPVLGRILSPLAFLYDPQLRSVMKKRQGLLKK